ncbi:MAG: hypothetical protein KDA93_25605 [Planctomycetaceae bacterium]|nr:hypothetical protein [Planctomycetaceae bacterium]
MEHSQPPHGADVFASHASCDCRLCQSKRDAVRRLVDSFSHIPTRWLAEVAAGDFEPVEWPMWGTAFIPKESIDADNIRKLLTEIVPTDDEQQIFAEQGWSEVADTGIYAIELDGELILGIHGAGYDFYESHWAPLYEALGYQWHETQ